MVAFHSNNSVLVRTRDGHNFVVQEPILLADDKGTLYRVPTGATTDGASTPPGLWPTIPPFGEYWLAAVVHDAAYRGTLETQLTDGSWASALLPKEVCDRLMLDCMLALGVDPRTANVIYEGVHAFGWKAFREDRGP